MRSKLFLAALAACGLVLTGPVSAQGVKIGVAGRLNGAEMARREMTHRGKVPLHTIRAGIDYAYVKAPTTYGTLGVKVWIYTGEVGEYEIWAGVPAKRIKCRP